MKMKTALQRMFLTAGLLAAPAGCTSKTEATRANFERGMQAYLAQRGDLCIGWSRWPIDVTDHAIAVGAADAVQLPVLERLGIVTSTVLPVRVGGRATPFNVRRYRLTTKGGERYMERATHVLVVPDDPTAASRADFCVAKLSLAKVESWDVQKSPTATTATVNYTYTVEAPAWTADAGFRKVFPAVARVLGGAGTAQLVEGFTLTGAGWTANELLPNAAAPRREGAQAAASP